jgi:DNA polymerase/3'-5' exonuclease PolX
MTTAELNQELFHQLSIIAGNENLMRKVVKAIKRIVKQEEEKDTTDQILASPAMMDIIKKGDEEIAEGNTQPIKLEDLWK